MQQQEFTSIINNKDYHFFVFSCPAKIPFNLAMHTWIVVRYPDGEMMRRELAHFKNIKEPKLGYLFKNSLKPWEGITPYIWETHKRFKSSLLYHCSGNSKSLAYKMVSWIEKNIEKYPYKNEYRLVWRNSNYFTQRVLKHFPEMKFKLPRNAIGK